MPSASLYTRTGDGLQAVAVPQSLSDEVQALQRKLAEARAQARELRVSLYTAIQTSDREARQNA